LERSAGSAQSSCAVAAPLIADFLESPAEEFIESGGKIASRWLLGRRQGWEPNEKLSLPKRKILIIFRLGGVRASTIPSSAVVVTVLAWHAAEITRFVTNQTFVVYTCSHCKLIKLFI
jgi:hypothetical protein